MYAGQLNRLVAISMATALTLIFLVAPGYAENDDFSRNGERTQPRYQVGLKVAYRIDDTKYHDYTPSLGGRFLYYPADWVAFTVGFHYNSHGEISDRASYKNLVVDFSWRFQARNGLFFNSLPYIEFGPVAPRYWVTVNGRKIAETNRGVRFAAGLSVPLTKRSSLDFTVSQVLNHYNNAIEVMAPIPDTSPCPVGADCGFSRRVPNGVYNEANFEMTLRFGL